MPPSRVVHVFVGDCSSGALQVSSHAAIAIRLTSRWKASDDLERVDHSFTNQKLSTLHSDWGSSTGLRYSNSYTGGITVTTFLDSYFILLLRDIRAGGGASSLNAGKSLLHYTSRARLHCMPMSMQMFLAI